MTVYRDLDVEGVCREYLPSRRVPDFAAVLAQCAADGERARQSLPTERIAYGPHGDEWLWFTPGPTPDAPVVVFVHGGYWHLLSADDGSFLAPAAHAAGHAFVSVNYTLCPDTTIDGIVEQVCRAVAAVAALAAQRSLGPVHLVGHSAGAHLVASVAQHGASIAGCVFVSGVYDLRPLVFTPDNDDIGLTPDDAVRLSPLLDAVHASVPAIVAWGADESAEFERQSREWAAAWGVSSTVVGAAGRHHFDVLLDLFDPNTALGAAVATQLGVSR